MINRTWNITGIPRLRKLCRSSSPILNFDEGLRRYNIHANNPAISIMTKIMIVGIIKVEKYSSDVSNKSRILSSRGVTLLGIFGGRTSVCPPSHIPEGVTCASTTLNGGLIITVTFSDNFSSSFNKTYNYKNKSIL